mmetsp:Transcript_17264/g.39820  ORF Transcript_17264/g.39820 Transcript_17264/m.39820 type:complete len:240 (+) Transcript_17264:1663-2382(+)
MQFGAPIPNHLLHHFVAEARDRDAHLAANGAHDLFVLRELSHRGFRRSGEGTEVCAKPVCGTQQHVQVVRVLLSVVEIPAPLLRLWLCVLLLDRPRAHQPQIRRIPAHKRHILWCDMIYWLSQLLQHLAHMREDDGTLSSGLVLVQRLQLDVTLGVRVHVGQTARQRKPPCALSFHEHLEPTHKDPERIVASAVVRRLVVSKKGRDLGRHLKRSQNVPGLRLCLAEILLIKSRRQLHVI